MSLPPISSSLSEAQPEDSFKAQLVTDASPSSNVHTLMVIAPQMEDLSHSDKLFNQRGAGANAREAKAVKAKVVEAKSAEGVAILQLTDEPDAQPSEALDPITAALELRTITTLQLLVPTAPGVLYFPGGELSSQTIGRYAEQLQHWFTPNLSATSPIPTPQILIYSQNFASGSQAQVLLDQLYFFTGADIITKRLRPLLFNSMN